MTLPVDVLVVGGGITGLAAAHRLSQSRDVRWMLVERAPRLGGKIVTERVGEYVIEGGPDCFLGARPGGIEFCRELGIDDRLVGTAPAFRRTFVRRDGRLHALPAGITGLVPTRLGPLLRTPALSVRGRVRAALEVLIPPRRDQADESIADFVSRRFGREAYDWLVEPLLSGIFAGDGRALSLRATFPHLADIERTHGSIIRMMLAQRRTAAERANRDGVRAGFLTLPGGLADLVDVVERRLPEERLRCGVSVIALRRTDGGFVAALDDGTEIETATVILALPAFAAADLVDAQQPALASALREIPFVSSATVSLAYDARDVPRPLDGYGFVSPRAAGGPLVACTWTSNKFPQRAPADGVLLRFFLGRAGDDGMVAEPDEDILDLVRAEAHRLHGISVAPRLWRIYAWPRGIPQYTLGHEDRVTRIDRLAAACPGLELAGASYTGVGIPACISAGRAAADRVVTAVAAMVS